MTSLLNHVILPVLLFYLILNNFCYAYCSELDSTNKMELVSDICSSSFTSADRFFLCLGFSTVLL